MEVAIEGAGTKLILLGPIKPLECAISLGAFCFSSGLLPFNEFQVRVKLDLLAVGDLIVELVGKDPGFWHAVRFLRSSKRSLRMLRQ